MTTPGHTRRHPLIPADPMNGFPMKIEIGTGNPPTTKLNPNTDTFVYEVLGYADKPGRSVQQKARFPGLPPPLPGKRRPVINPPQTLLKGIVGPLNPTTGALEVFQYIDKTDPAKTPLNSAAGRVGNI